MYDDEEEKERKNNNIQGELWETEFSVVFHLTTAVHNFDSRLVLN
jgi:hypothetical protein